MIVRGRVGCRILILASFLAFFFWLSPCALLAQNATSTDAPPALRPPQPLMQPQPAPSAAPPGQAQAPLPAPVPSTMPSTGPSNGTAPPRRSRNLMLNQLQRRRSLLCLLRLFRPHRLLSLGHLLRPCSSQRYRSLRSRQSSNRKGRFSHNHRLNRPRRRPSRLDSDLRRFHRLRLDAALRLSRVGRSL